MSPNIATLQDDSLNSTADGTPTNLPLNDIGEITDEAKAPTNINEISHSHKTVTGSYSSAENIQSDTKDEETGEIIGEIPPAQCPLKPLSINLTQAINNNQSISKSISSKPIARENNSILSMMEDLASIVISFLIFLVRPSQSRNSSRRRGLHTTK